MGPTASSIGMLTSWPANLLACKPPVLEFCKYIEKRGVWGETWVSGLNHANPLAGLQSLLACKTPVLDFCRYIDKRGV